MALGLEIRGYADVLSISEVSCMEYIGASIEALAKISVLFLKFKSERITHKYGPLTSLDK